MASRGKKEEVVYAKPMNQFAALDMSSDSEAEDEEDALTPSPEPEPEPEPVPLTRTWKLSPEDEARRVREGPPAFSSKRNRKPHEDTHGWTTIQWNKPQFKDDESLSTCSEKEIQKEVELEAKVLEDVDIPEAPAGQQFPSLLNRGSAQMWAEKIKASLDRAEASRPSLSKPTEDFVEGLGRLSFFRSK